MEDVVAAPAAPEVTPPAAPNAGVTATPTPGEPSPAEPTPPTPKVFTQEDVDALIGKRLAREERKWQREADRRVAEIARQQPAQQPTQAPTKPLPDQYQSTEAYVEALAEWKANEIFQKRSHETERNGSERQARVEAEAAARSYEERVSAVKEKYPDYDDVVGNPSLSITDHMAQTIALSEQGPEVAYYLGQNPSEASRIARLSPFLQAKELGRLEAKISTAAPVPKETSRAPAPITPVTPRGPGPETEPDPSKDYGAWLRWSWKKEGKLR